MVCDLLQIYIDENLDCVLEIISQKCREING